MTARELISNIRRMGPQDTRVLFHYMADAAIEAKLATGHSLCDLGDFIAWLRELADAADLPDRVENVPVQEAPPQNCRSLPKAVRKFSSRDFCARCGHVHKPGEKECGEDMGGAGICKCDVEVSA